MLPDSFFWAIHLILAVVLVIWLEKRRRKETFDKISSWLKNKSERIQRENHDDPKIIADLNSDWQLKHIEITTFTGEYGHHTGTYERTFLRISGISNEGQFVNLALKDNNPFDENTIGSEFSEDVKSGDPMFDFWHIIKSGTPEVALKLLKDREFRDYIRNIVDLKIFEVKGNKNLKFTVECGLDFKSAKNAILAMKRAAKILKS